MVTVATLATRNDPQLSTHLPRPGQPRGVAAVSRGDAGSIDYALTADPYSATIFPRRSRKGDVMQLGLFSACLPWLTLDEVADWAASAGYDALEVAAWPSGDHHPHHATHLEVDGQPIYTERICALLAGHGLALSAVSYYENNLIGDL